MRVKFGGISSTTEANYTRVMKAISIKLPDPLFHDLAQRAKASASTQSEVIRAALSAYLQADAKASTASCAERASKWVGLGEGASDLASNPAHLAGFGGPNP